MHPFRVVLDDAGSDLLVGADANVIDAYNIHHFLKTTDVSFEAGEEVPDADRTLCLPAHGRP
jgi:hypothetical protein